MDDTVYNIPFIFDPFKGKDIFIKKENLGWKDTDHDASISTLGKDDPLYFYMDSGIDIGFYYDGHKYWIESPFENFRNHGGDIWSLSICDTPDPESTGEYLRGMYLGLDRHDAKNRREICFYDGIDAFIQNVKINGKNIRDVLEESFIMDL